jgi:hypothetical protein
MRANDRFGSAAALDILSPQWPQWVDSEEKPPIRLASGFERKAVIGSNAICNCMFGRMSTNTTAVTAASGLLVTLA